MGRRSGLVGLPTEMGTDKVTLEPYEGTPIQGRHQAEALDQENRRLADLGTPITSGVGNLFTQFQAGAFMVVIAVLTM